MHVYLLFNCTTSIHMTYCGTRCIKVTFDPIMEMLITKLYSKTEYTNDFNRTCFQKESRCSTFQNQRTMIQIKYFNYNTKTWTHLSLFSTFLFYKASPAMFFFFFFVSELIRFWKAGSFNNKASCFLINCWHGEIASKTLKK